MQVTSYQAFRARVGVAVNADAAVAAPLVAGVISALCSSDESRSLAAHRHQPASRGVRRHAHLSLLAGGPLVVIASAIFTAHDFSWNRRP